MGVAISLQTLSTPLTTNSTLLVPTEEGLRSRLLPRVDENRSGFQTSADPLGALEVLAPDTGSETGVGAVGATDDVLLVGPGEGGDDGAERLFLDDAAVLGWVVNDGGLDEEALAGFDIRFADGELVVLFL